MGTAFLVFLGSLVVLLLAAELGFTVGRRRRAGSDQDGRSQVSMVEGALLGVLGLLIGFTFSMAVARFDVRQELVVREANALSTLYLRCELLHDADRIAIRAKLREYTDLRLEYISAGVDLQKLDAVFDRTIQLQSTLWALACEEARQRPSIITDSLLTSMTDVFDLAETRRTAMYNQVPLSVWVVLYIVAALSAASLGLGSGLTGRRVRLSVAMVPLLLAVILTLLVDLAHPRIGLIRLSEDSMIRLRAGMK